MNAAALVNRLCEHYAVTDDLPSLSVLWPDNSVSLEVGADGCVRIPDLEDALLAVAIVTHVAITVPHWEGGHLGAVMDLQRVASDYLTRAA